jgi:hypothetical protein
MHARLEEEAMARKLKVLNIAGHSIVEIHVGTDTALIFFFVAYNADQGPDIVCPYAFVADSSKRINYYINLRQIGDPKLTESISKIPFSMTEVAGSSVAQGYNSKTPIGVNELLRGPRGGESFTGRFTFVAQHTLDFMTRVHIDHGLEFNVSFKGNPPGNPPGKLTSKHQISGEFTVLGVFEGPDPASGPVAWGKAFQAMDNFITPLKPVVAQQPLFNLPALFDLQH